MSDGGLGRPRIALWRRRINGGVLGGGLALVVISLSGLALGSSDDRTQAVRLLIVGLIVTGSSLYERRQLRRERDRGGPT